MKSIGDIKERAQLENVPILKDEGFEYLKEKILEYHCHSFLEIGTAVGFTAIRVAQLDPSMRVVTIERDPERAQQARENIQQMHLEDQITLIEKDAFEVELNDTFDCIFIDAAKAQYTRFFHKFSPLLSCHGIIISDNMKFHGLVEHPERTKNRNTRQLVRKLKEYHDFLEQLDDFIVEFTDQGDGMALARRKI
ncbi:O-methyltransferase [uncultured Faecalicoccus sp.]|uniref:O-methyltransferase n=1 Tax=uncultured Faecalicoccus sp. TaxID=1971760 RepID=UPI0025DD9C05|nr:O-methyltransferase [uncultured Faecalicoccus sp.]